MRYPVAVTINLRTADKESFKYINMDVQLPIIMCSVICWIYEWNALCLHIINFYF